MGRRDAVPLGDAELALVSAAAGVDHVSGVEPELGRFDVRRGTPTADLDGVGIEVLQADVVVEARGRGIIDSLGDALCDLTKLPRPPAIGQLAFAGHAAPSTSSSFNKL